MGIGDAIKMEELRKNGVDNETKKPMQRVLDESIVREVVRAMKFVTKKGIFYTDLKIPL